MAPSRGFTWNHSLSDTLHFFWKPKIEEMSYERPSEGQFEDSSTTLGDISVDSSHGVEKKGVGNNNLDESSHFSSESNEDRIKALLYSKQNRKHSVDIIHDSKPTITRVMTEFIFDSEEIGSQIFLCGDWNNWEPIPMVAATSDASRWSIITPVPVGYHDFGFVSNEGVWRWSRKHPYNETKCCNWRRIRGPSKSQKGKDSLSPSWWTLLGCVPLFILLWIMIVLEKFKAIFVDDAVVLSECDNLVKECLGGGQEETVERRNNYFWSTDSEDRIFQCALKVCKMFPRTDILMIRDLHWKRLFLVAITIYTLGRFLPEVLWVLLQ